MIGALAIDSRITILANYIPSPIFRVCRRPKNGDTVSVVFSLTANLIDRLDFSIVLPLDGFNMSINLAIICYFKVADFVTSSVLVDISTAADNLVGFARVPPVMAHPADIEEDNF